MSVFLLLFVLCFIFCVLCFVFCVLCFVLLVAQMSLPPMPELLANPAKWARNLIPDVDEEIAKNTIGIDSGNHASKELPSNDSISQIRRLALYPSNPASSNSDGMNGGLSAGGLQKVQNLLQTPPQYSEIKVCVA
jgi:hypothetical protein